MVSGYCFDSYPRVFHTSVFLVSILAGEGGGGEGDKCDGLASISTGCNNIPSCFMPLKNNGV